MAHDEFFKMLHKDHEEVMNMLNQLKEMPDSDASGREELFTQLKSELVPHMRGEEKAFYPELQKHKASKEHAMEGLEEHHIAEVSMMELEKMSKDEEFWSAKLSVFKELISHHVEEEESNIFEDAKNELTEEKMESIMQNFQNEKESTKGKLTASRSSSKSSS